MSGVEGPAAAALSHSERVAAPQPLLESQRIRPLVESIRQLAAAFGIDHVILDGSRPTGEGEPLEFSAAAAKPEVMPKK